MTVRPLGHADLARLGWLAEGTRQGMGRALAAGAVTLVADDAGTPTGVAAVDLPPGTDPGDGGPEPWTRMQHALLNR